MTDFTDHPYSEWIKSPTGAAESASRSAHLPRLLQVPSEDHMFVLLSALNVSGDTADLACVSVVDVGGPGRPNLSVSAFIAALTEPDADYVNYVRPGNDGYSMCPAECDNCGSLGPDAWKPTYPVTAILAVEPDAERAREDEIDVWWVRDE